MENKDLQIKARRERVYVLYFCRGLSVTDIARKLGVDRRTVHRDLQVIRKELREELERQNVTPDVMLVMIREYFGNIIKQAHEILDESRRTGENGKLRARLLDLLRRTGTDYFKFLLELKGVKVDDATKTYQEIIDRILEE